MSQISISPTSAAPPPTVATQYVTDSGTAIPAANILNVLGGNSTVQTSGTGNTLTITVVNDGFKWSDQALSFVATVQNGYFCTAALTVTLPTVGLVTGSTVIIYVDTASAVVIKAGAGQQIEISNALSSVAGTATSTGQGDILEVVYRASDTTWHTISSQGTFTLA